jgi:hypothetical protein
MHGPPDLVLIVPDMVGQTHGHRWGAWRATLAQALLRPHNIVQADQEPDLPPEARAAPGPTPGAAPQGGDEPTQGAIPAFPTGRLDRRAALAPAHRLAQTAGAAAPHPGAALHHLASLGAALDQWGRAQLVGSHQPRLWRATSLAPPAAALEHPEPREQRRRRRLPPLREAAWPRPPPGHDLGATRRGHALGAWAAVHPQAAPTAHGPRGLHLCHRRGTQCGMRLIPVPPLPLAGLYALPVGRLSPWGSHARAARAGLEVPATEGGSPLLTDTPALAWHQPYDGSCRERAAGPQGARPCRALPAACRTAQPCDVLVPPGPRPMREVAFAGTMAPGTVWIRARAWRRALWGWRCPCHNSPPVARHGLKDTGSTPVSPRYYSPGLPVFHFSIKKFSTKIGKKRGDYRGEIFI